jgi:hypothetical protein
MVAAGERGMNFADRPRIQTLVPDASNWKQIFDDFAAKDVQFVIYVDSVKMDTHGQFHQTHLICKYANLLLGILKYYEVRNKILTQHITIEVSSFSTHKSIHNIPIPFSARHGCSWSPSWASDTAEYPE